MPLDARGLFVRGEHFVRRSGFWVSSVLKNGIGEGEGGRTRLETRKQKNWKNEVGREERSFCGRPRELRDRIKAGGPGLKLLRSHREIVTKFGNCGPTGRRDRHHNDSREHEQPMRRGGRSLAQRSPPQMPSRFRLEEHVQRRTG